MTAVDLFAGCGGLSLGLRSSGINVVAAYENWLPALAIYRNNFTHPAYRFDLGNENEAIVHIRDKKPDLIAGGPPCQDFSSAGKRNENGGRGDLTLSFAKIVTGVQPTWFLMENVERISKSYIFQEAKQIFKDCNYGLTEIVLDASLCGVPQKRKRMFLIGKKYETDDFLRDVIVSGLNSESLTVRQYFGNELDVNYYYRHARSYARRGIFSVDEPSPTIRGVNRPIPPDYKFHPGDSTDKLSFVRPLTTEERARIQTFPKNFIWTGPNRSILEQIIGNAVPVNLANYIGNAISEFDKGVKKSTLTNAYQNG